MEKLPWESRTNWVGLAIVLLPVLQWTVDANIFAEYPGIVSFIGVLMIILRKLTDSPVTWKTKRF